MQHLVQHLLDATWDHVPLRQTAQRFPVQCGRVVGIAAVVRVAGRPWCVDCLTAANLRQAVA